jgi:hypothetical protein
MKDIHIFFPPYNELLLMPELGAAQLCGWLRAKGYDARQTDLNALLRGMETREERRVFSKPVFYADRTIWSPDVPSLRLDAVLKACRKPNAVYEKLYLSSVKPELKNCRCAGFSIVMSSQLPAALYFCARARKDYPRIKTVLGGSWVSCSWNALKKWPELFTFADYMVGYAGELPLERLLAALRAEKTIEHVPSLAFLKFGKVAQNRIAPELPPEKIPAPVFDGIDLNLYHSKKLPYQTRTGCEWGRCKFCAHVYPGNPRAAKSMAKVLREVMAIQKKYSPQLIQLADHATPLPVLDAFSRGLIARRANISWNTMTRANPGLDRELAQQLVESGCTSLAIGLETVDDKALAKLNKGISFATVKANIRACSQAGLPVSLFIINYPGQSLRELEKTVDFTISCGARLSYIAFERFALTRWITGRDWKYGSDAPGQDTELDSFNLPFHGEGVPESSFRALRAKVAAHRHKTPGCPAGKGRLAASCAPRNKC